MDGFTFSLHLLKYIEEGCKFWILGANSEVLFLTATISKKEREIRLKEFTICYTFDQYVITEKIVREHDVQKETLEKEIIEKMELNPSFFVKNEQECCLIISSLVRYVKINHEKILIG